MPSLRLARGGARDVLQNKHPAAARRVEGEVRRGKESFAKRVVFGFCA